MPKTSHRRGQPKPGNRKNQPPSLSSRGRGHRPTSGRGGQPPFNTDPTPVQSDPEPIDKQVERVEIVEEEIFHEGEQQIEEVKYEQKETPPIFKKSSPFETQKSDDSLEFVGNKNYEESENRKRETKAMFGKLFENDEPENNSRTRGRSPNFSEQRYSNYEDDPQDYQPPAPKNPEKGKKLKTQRVVDLNKSVDLFGRNMNKIDNEPLTQIEDENNALNTSFGVEDSSALNVDDGSSANKIFSTVHHEEPQNRSKTPPVTSKRPPLKKEVKDQDQYHKAIGAKEDFIIEEPIVEPERENKQVKEEHSFETPQVNIDSNERDMQIENEVKSSPNLPSSISKENPKKIFEEIKWENSKSDKQKESKRRKILYDEDDKTQQNKFQNSQMTDSTFKNIKHNLKSDFGAELSTGNNLKYLNKTKYDQTVPISRTSSVKSVPDELERANESLKAK